MTVMGGGDRSLTTVTRSLLRARASTLHQLTGWPISSDTDTEGTCEFTNFKIIIVLASKYQNPSNTNQKVKPRV